MVKENFSIHGSWEGETEKGAGDKKYYCRLAPSQLIMHYIFHHLPVITIQPSMNSPLRALMIQSHLKSHTYEYCYIEYDALWDIPVRNYNITQPGSHNEEEKNTKKTDTTNFRTYHTANLTKTV